ncbi:uncharacterized protein LOC131613075 [Vicia villosa]|uniref:uncharacterized protein LOC131613075 n=1 Tax=Vicia villosa TaxID=3911 RepID=UPI00273B0C2B|nr:uncharacterized protein LOC131613075 [Vicia villosa]
MLKVDIETLVSACAGGSTDRKIACESQADDHKTDPPVRIPDSPPESFYLSKDEETEWLDRNFVYERKESTKGNSNSGNLNPNSTSNTSTNSQRFANLKSKTSMIGLPKPQKPSFIDAKNRRNNKPSNIKLFPKRTASVGKSFAEPSSPKVSCMGRVRSKRGRTSSAAAAAVKESSPRTEKKRGFFGSLRSIFRSGGRNKPDRRTDSPAMDSTATNTNGVSNSKARDSTASLNDVSFVESVSRNSISESEPLGLGGMNRFKSGRRSDSWGGDDSEIHVSR